MILKDIDKEQQQLRKRLVPGTELHNQILQYVKDCFAVSRKSSRQRHEKWRASERLYYAYVDPDEKDSAGKKLYPFNRSIVVPYTYAILQTRLTYFFLALVTKSPIIPIEGRGPDDIVAAKMMEVVNDYQLTSQSAVSVFYSWIQDSERYGVGVVKNTYRKIQEDRYFNERTPIALFGMKLFEREKRVRKLSTLYEGNILTNITPYNFVHDPHVNVCDLHSGEFAGFESEKTYSYLISREREGEYFNIEYCKRKKNMSTGDFEREGDLGNNFSELSNIVGVSPVGTATTIDAKHQGSCKIKELHCTLIPKDRNLGSSIYPEIWIISLADDQTVIRCEPSEDREYPYYAIESNHDYSSPYNLGMGEMLKGLGDILSWMFNSHIDNVQKVLNDVLVVNPYYVNVNDLFSEDPVKVITLREQGYMLPGGIDSVFKQLQSSDITRNHIQDSSHIMSLMQRVSAATDNIMGMVEEEVKRTATETTSTINLATSRLKMNIKLMSALGVMPMTRGMSFNNQQKLTEELFYSITSDLAKALGKDPRVVQKRMLIGPKDLYGDFLFKYPSADLPIDKIQQANAWKEMLREVAGNPVLMKKFDMVPIFTNWLYNMGIPNSSEFQYGAMEVQDDEAVQGEVDKGNLVNMSEVLKNIDISGLMGQALGAPVANGNSNGIPNVGNRESEV